MSQKLPVNNFEWIKNISQCNKYYNEKTIMKKVMKDISLKLMFNIFINSSWFAVSTWKNENWESRKLNMLYT